MVRMIEEPRFSKEGWLDLTSEKGWRLKPDAPEWAIQEFIEVMKNDLRLVDMSQLDKALYDYEERFDDSFPTIPLLMEKSDEEVVDMIYRCIALDKEVYNLGILSLNEMY